MPVSATQIGREFALQVQGGATLTYGQSELVGLGCKRIQNPGWLPGTAYDGGRRTVVSAPTIDARFGWEISLQLTDARWLELQEFLAQHWQGIRTQSDPVLRLYDRVMPLVSPVERIRDGDDDFIAVGDGIAYYGQFLVVVLPDPSLYQLAGRNGSTPFWNVNLRAIEHTPTAYNEFFAFADGYLAGYTPDVNLQTNLTGGGSEIADRSNTMLVNAAYQLLPNFTAAELRETPVDITDGTGRIQIAGNRRYIKLVTTNRNMPTRPNSSTILFVVRYSITALFLRAGQYLIYRAFGAFPAFTVDGVAGILTDGNVTGGAFVGFFWGGVSLALSAQVSGSPSVISNSTNELYLLGAQWFPPGATITRGGVLSFTAATYSVCRYHSGFPLTIVATIKRDAGSDGEVSVIVGVDPESPGTAVIGVDYAGLSTRVVFAPGELTKDVRILVAASANTRTLRLKLSRTVSSAVIGVVNSCLVTLNPGGTAGNVEYLDGNSIQFISDCSFMDFI